MLQMRIRLTYDGPRFSNDAPEIGFLRGEEFMHGKLDPAGFGTEDMLQVDAMIFGTSSRRSLLPPLYDSVETGHVGKPFL